MKGQAKEELRKWLVENQVKNATHTKEENVAFDLNEFKTHIVPFEYLHKSMQWGVIVDFFREVDKIHLSIPLKRQNSVLEGHEDFYSPSIKRIGDEDDFAKDLFTYKLFKEEPEARQAAIDKACEILNERLSK